MVSYRKTVTWFVGSLFLLGACSTTLEIDQLRHSANQKPLQRIEISGVPFFAQEQYQCGPAALAMLLNWSGLSVSPDELKSMVYIPERKGSFQLEMVAAVRGYQRIPYELSPGWQSLIAEVEAGNPVLVLQNLGLDWFTNWHYAVVKGIDLRNNEIILNSGTTENYVTNLRTFERTWQRANKWAMVVLRPGEIPVTANTLQYLKAVAAIEETGQTDLALQAYLSAVKRWPGELAALMGVGNAYYQLRDLENAKLSYQQAIKQNSEYAPAHNNLAQVYLELGKLNEASDHAQIAVQMGGVYIKQYRHTLNQVEQQRAMRKN